jgi:NADH dehydrogenase (ubiquinone) 1 alpha subcomplex subunit 8
MPDHIPKVKEIGATSAPLMSASFFIGARCRPYNDDYMQCKTESYGRGELDCMKEGRKVTRCAASVLVYLQELEQLKQNTWYGSEADMLLEQTGRHKQELP